ncbi:sterol 26-hydroxylase, mitochondrial [Periophthalmus magnuspinnatus]|uniref:sterol 26-hydroxylase, mitochondrial n=1 Tax=Periophthalmus magnuspinnatus TaxID=409849 RepID=UPI00145BF345|nr:sterol 26-hydroxylase, mitochondrial [Periophthalmus magnuspinnatus]
MRPAAAAARSVRLSALGVRVLAPVRPGLCCSRSVSAQAATSDTTGKMKTIDDLPGPSFAKSLYWILFKGFAQKGHLMQDFQKNLYGPIWRSRFGPYDLVNVASAELISQVIKQEGQYPVRVLLPHWKEYRELRGQAYGLHVETGPNWYRIRSVLNQKMLKPREVRAYAPVIHQVVDDLLQRIQFLRDRSPDRTTVPDIASELYKFGFEGVSAILFETRLGCLQEDVPKDTLRFIRAVNNMFLMSDIVAMSPRWTRLFLPHWKRFVEAWDDLSDVAQGLVERRMRELEQRVDSGSSIDGLYLTYLLSNDKITKAEIYTSITELLLGGVDTTSNTLTWALYHLSRDQRAQDLLSKEVQDVCPNLKQPSMDDISQMPYLKAVIKEALRLYPVVPGNARYVTENDLIVGEYWFPKGTLFHLCHYAVSHSAEEFPEPERFIPERWLRPGLNTDGAYSRSLPSVQEHHPYSYIPFGVGVRACVGKRVAEMEMYLALSRLMQKYEVRPEDGAPLIAAKTRILMIPGTPVNLRFLHRA